MKLRGVPWGLVALLWSVLCPAQALRWDAGPALRLAQYATVVPLHDGRLFACPAAYATTLCEVVDPLTAQRQSVARPSGRVLDAVSLGGNEILLRSGERLDVQSGESKTWPNAPTDMATGYAQELSNGRAAFWLGEGTPFGCGTVTFFVGGQRGFQVVQAAALGNCVAGVFELGNNEVLIARRLAPRADSVSDEFDFVRLNLETWTWQRGRRLAERRPVAAFRHANGFGVLMATQSGSSSKPAVEAMFFDAAGVTLKMTQVTEVKGSFTARPYGEEVLLLEERQVTRWRPSTGQLVRAERNAPPLQGPWVVEREGKLVLIDREGHNATFVLVEDATVSTTPCDEAFDYVLNVMRSGRPNTLEEGRLRELTSGQCTTWLDAQAGFPDAIARSIESLTTRVEGPASPEEDAAARALCAFMPGFGSSPIAALARSKLLHVDTRQRCAQSNRLMPVIVAAQKGQGVSNALVKVGFPHDTSLRHEVVVLLASRERLRKSAAPLLLAAREHRASGFDELREVLCLPLPDPAMASACAATSRDYEEGWNAEWRAKREAEEHLQILRNFGIATGIMGGLGGLAYLDRHGVGGRAIAIGSGAVAGGVLGGFVTIGAAKGGDVSGLGGILLAIPVTILTGIAGGLITASTSSTPGDARFASAAVPLGGLWLFSAGIAIDKW